MIEKLDKDCGKLQKKINELVDAVNSIQKEREAERFEIQEWIGIIEAVRESVNIHENKIKELQDNQNTYWTDIGEIKAKIAKGFENLKAPIDPYAEQRKWIGKLCRFRDKHSDVWEYGTLENVEDVDHAIDCAFRSSDGYWYDICEPIKPDDDIIYKGGDNE